MVSLSADIPEWNLRWPYAPAVRARNSVSYLTARRFSAQDRVNAIRAIKRLKADAGEHEIGLAAAEIALLWLRVSGNPGGWTVTNIAAGHSGGNSFGARLAVADRLSLGYLQVWRDRPIKGVSHPKEFRRLPMVAKPIGATLVIDDVAPAATTRLSERVLRQHRAGPGASLCPRRCCCPIRAEAPMGRCPRMSRPSTAAGTVSAPGWRSLSPIG